MTERDHLSPTGLDTLRDGAHVLSRALFRVAIGSPGAVADSVVPEPWSDGSIRIPRAADPARLSYDRRFIHDVLAYFAPNAPAVAVVSVPTDVDRVVHANGVRNHDRYELYRTMLSAGEPVPPIFVERLGDRYFVRDGNHRTHAARAAGISQLVGLLVAPDSVAR